MASVHLDFIPPNVPDLTHLKIYESTSKDGPWSMIEDVTPVGNQGNYLSQYTTNAATSAENWFQIEWIDSKGAITQRSNSVQGGTLTLVADIVDRMLVRDSTMNEQVAVESAEAAIQDYFGVPDPYSLGRTAATATEKLGLTLLALSWAYTTTLISQASGTSESYTAGLVQQSGGSKTGTISMKEIAGFINAANRLLNRQYSVVLLMKQKEITGARGSLVVADLSRNIVEVGG